MDNVADTKKIEFTFGTIEQIDFRVLLPEGQEIDVYANCSCGCCNSCGYCDNCGSPAPSDC
jgi:hypothetical protein